VKLIQLLLFSFLICLEIQASDRFPVPSPESVKEYETYVMELGKDEVLSLSYIDLIEFIWDRYVLGMDGHFSYGGCNPKKLTYEESSRPATILLHGAGANQGHWVPFIDLKNQLGWGGPVFTFNYLQETDLEQLRAKITEIRDLYLKAGRQEVSINLVGHSLGAICSADYAYRPENWVEGTRVEKVVSMGGRLRNLEPPIDTPYYPYCFDVLERIDGIWANFLENRGEVRLCAIAGADDWLVPQESMLIGDINVVISNLGHGLINRFPAANRAALEFLYLK